MPLWPLRPFAVHAAAAPWLCVCAEVVQACVHVPSSCLGHTHTQVQRDSLCEEQSWRARRCVPHPCTDFSRTLTGSYDDVVDSTHAVSASEHRFLHRGGAGAACGVLSCAADDCATACSVVADCVSARGVADAAAFTPRPHTIMR